MQGGNQVSSYQDIDVRLAVAEDKLDFVMKTFSVTKQYESFLVPGQVIRETKSLLDLYREVKGVGLTLEAAKPSSEIVGEVLEGDGDGGSV